MLKLVNTTSCGDLNVRRKRVAWSSGPSPFFKTNNSSSRK